MEYIFKRYQKSEFHKEITYLVYDPTINPAQFDTALMRSILVRNFGQGFSNLLIGPIVNGEKITARVLNPDGSEASMDSDSRQIFNAYLKNRGYQTPGSFDDTDIHEAGTVYHFAS